MSTERWIAILAACAFTIVFASTLLTDSSDESSIAVVEEVAAEETEETAVDAMLRKIDETGGSAAQSYFIVAVKTEDAIRSGKLAESNADFAHNAVRRNHLPDAPTSVQAVVDEIRQLSDKDVRALLKELSG
ncbi:MAG: hypothetical protein OYG31_01880 [Candidatus Kaiserbacteria bacterium]|nr:hypothetical protein [Candidatus Kaiserbacteria bacterium]